MFEKSVDTEPASGRMHRFLRLTVLGIVTCALLAQRAIYAFRAITHWGWLYLGLTLLAVALAAFHYVRLERGFSGIAKQIDETALERLQSSAEWLYIVFNAAIFSLMHFIPRWHGGR